MTTGASAQLQPIAVELRGVSRWYGAVVAVNDVSFALEPGITGLLGPNGAGKSTLLHLAAGLLRPSVGSVTVRGRPAFGRPDLYRDIGLVPERDGLYDGLTGHELAVLAARLHGLADARGAADRAIDAADLGSVRDRPIGSYSKGMRQRAKIAAALVHDPPIVLLDEPFNGMDPRQRLEMMALLRGMSADGRVILFSSHILEEVERLAETVLVVVAGRLAASGAFRAIRRLMTDRPHEYLVRSSDDRRLASALVAGPSVDGVDVRADGLVIRTSDFAAFTRDVPRVAKRRRIRLLELRPTDDSLERVFSYLVDA